MRFRFQPDECTAWRYIGRSVSCCDESTANILIIMDVVEGRLAILRGVLSREVRGGLGVVSLEKSVNLSIVPSVE